LRILVTGSEGMLGRALMDRLAGAHQLTGVDLAQGDLTRRDDVADLTGAGNFDWVLHCAAWTDVAAAEMARDEAMAVNADATANLCAACESRGLGMTYISTDYVFDGRGESHAEDAPRRPVNHYGLTKARGEEAVERLSGPWQIVRTSWLFGDGPRNFVKTVRRLLAERESLQVVDDQRGCPTYADDLADVLGFLVSGAHRGIFHGTNRGVCTWFDLAQEVARCCGEDPSRIRPCSSSDYPTAAVRPACSVLSSSNLERAGCPPRPEWRDAVRRYVARLESGGVLFP
jgi:dTDP-4-dehydrorhamnose reductase